MPHKTRPSLFSSVLAACVLFGMSMVLLVMQPDESLIIAVGISAAVLFMLIGILEMLAYIADVLHGILDKMK